MALVAYDNSDSSEFEDDDTETTTTSVVLNNKVESKMSYKFTRFLSFRSLINL